MDPGFFSAAYDSIAVTGTGCVIGERPDSSPFLLSRKSRKFMGVQDDLAVCSAGTALKMAGLSPAQLGERAGLFLVAGYIPFELSDIQDLLTGSICEGQFSMPLFSLNGFHAINPLLTFRCLPNMPAYHISANFNIQGTYVVSYPGPAQFYTILEEALSALQSERIDVALLSGVAHQRNLLVEHHYGNLEPAVPPSGIIDAAGCVIMERRSHASTRNSAILGHLVSHQYSYQSFDPLLHSGDYFEKLEGCEMPQGECGAASLPVALSLKGSTSRKHRLLSRDGVQAFSHWEFS